MLESWLKIDGWLKDNGKRLCASVIVATYLRFLLLPTATFFFEAYHLFKFEFLYVGYQLFKVVGYAVSVWDHRNLAAIGIAILIFLIALLIKVRSTKNNVQEVV